MNNLIILGAGGHGRVVAEAAELEGRWDSIAFLDDCCESSLVLGFEVAGKLEDYLKVRERYQYAFAALGNSKVRAALIRKCEEAGYIIPTIIHPKAIVAKSSSIGKGTVILAGAMLNTRTVIEKGAIVNVNSTVDHDSEIGEYVHIGSGATIRSAVSIGKFSTVGAGVIVSAGYKLAEYSHIKDGEVVG